MTLIMANLNCKQKDCKGVMERFTKHKNYKFPHYRCNKCNIIEDI